MSDAIQSDKTTLQDTLTTNYAPIRPVLSVRKVESALEERPQIFGLKTVGFKALRAFEATHKAKSTVVQNLDVNAKAFIFHEAQKLVELGAISGHNWQQRRDDMVHAVRNIRDVMNGTLTPSTKQVPTGALNGAQNESGEMFVALTAAMIEAYAIELPLFEQAAASERAQKVIGTMASHIQFCLQFQDLSDELIARAPNCSYCLSSYNRCMGNGGNPYTCMANYNNCIATCNP